MKKSNYFIFSIIVVMCLSCINQEYITKAKGVVVERNLIVLDYEQFSIERYQYIIKHDNAYYEVLRLDSCSNVGDSIQFTIRKNVNNFIY